MIKCISKILLILLLHNLGSINSKWTPEIPSECTNEYVCDDKIPNYPKRALINKTIKKLQEEGSVIGLDQHTFDPPPTLGPKDTDLCRSDVRTLIPNGAKDANTNKWRFVINDPHRPVQVVTVEVCSKPDAPCDKLKSKYFKIKSGYQARCVQKFFRKTLLGFNETGHVIHFGTLLPMCCDCVLEHH